MAGARVNYHNADGIILFNQQSSIRGETCVTRKIAGSGAHIDQGPENAPYRGNLRPRVTGAA